MNENDIVKYLSGELGEEEVLTFEQELLNNPELKELYHSYARAWKYAAFSKVQDDENTKVAFQKISKNLPQSGRSIQLKLIPYAAAVAVIAFFSLVFLNKSHVKTTDTSTEIVLKDNSRLVINKNSELVYNKWFNKRSVQLTGEAYFDIQKLENRRPFTVSTEKSKITVLGTSFYVSAYEPKKNLEVAVTSGKVKVYGGIDSKENEELLLQKGEMVQVYYNENRVHKLTDFNENKMAWNTGILKFKNEPFEKVISVIKNLYNIDVKTNFDNGETLYYTGNIESAEMDHVIRTLAETFGLNYKISSNKELAIFFK